MLLVTPATVDGRLSEWSGRHLSAGARRPASCQSCGELGRAETRAGFTGSGPGWTLLGQQPPQALFLCWKELWGLGQETPLSSRLIINLVCVCTWFVRQVIFPESKYIVCSFYIQIEHGLYLVVNAPFKFTASGSSSNCCQLVAVWWCGAEERTKQGKVGPVREACGSPGPSGPPRLLRRNSRP